MSAVPHANLQPSADRVVDPAAPASQSPVGATEPEAVRAPSVEPALPGARAPRVATPSQSWIQRWFDKAEAFASKLAMRDNFWNSICSLIWLPLAFFSGLKLKQISAEKFAAYLPFRRFNRNWYRAMAGGALLANSEIAGGSYVFGVCGADYTVVCKNLNYTFLRPCFGPAVYHITPRQDLKGLVATRGEFNITIDMEILQQAGRVGERDKRVGRCEAIFHVTPKAHHKVRAARRR